MPLVDGAFDAEDEVMPNGDGRDGGGGMPLLPWVVDDDDDAARVGISGSGVTVGTTAVVVLGVNVDVDADDGGNGLSVAVLVAAATFGCGGGGGMPLVGVDTLRRLTGPVLGVDDVCKKYRGRSTKKVIKKIKKWSEKEVVKRREMPSSKYGSM